ncbi:substrate-binding domain-containing protein [Pedobacter sp. UBA4863]|uniref:substrate-binding domain-containing protein n=1 Tax=Pedobacter sp. UBA4863 TaxID=1947060 RepID=UPI0025D3A6F4|nr:substrate-binding domain-containing protein [Pedobacter sp. UBA4863]
MLTSSITRILVLCLLTCSFLGCTELQPTKRFRIGFSQCIGDDQWRISMLKEIKRELAFHEDVTFLYEDAGGNSEVQISQVKSLLEQNIDLLIISPNEAKPLTAIVEQAMDSGIPVIVIDRKIATRNFTAYVGANNYQIGELTADYLGSQFKNLTKVVAVLGLAGSSPAIERQQGFEDAIKKYDHIQLTHRIYGDWLKTTASQEVENNIKAFAAADVVFAHNDQMALGVYEALKKHGLHAKLKLIGVDALAGQGNGLDLVESKVLTASLLYPTGGKQAINTAIDILKEKPFKKDNLLKTTVIDASNVQIMKMQEERLDQQQSNIERQQNMLEEQHKVYRGQRFTLNILVVSLVLAVVFGGVSFYSLSENWKNNKKLEEQNSEIIANEKQLREMTAKAADATEAKIQFFTNVSHEFRTPITLMLLPIEELLKERNLTLQAKERLLLLQRSARRILKMVNELIDFKKIGDEKLQVRLENVDIIAFAKEIIQAFDNVAKQKFIDLRLLTQKRTILATVDLQLFDRVLFNLIGNAIKFTPKYGHVYVSIDEADSILSIKIEDSGVGMSEEELAQAFEPFYQGRNVGIQGSGLGLSLCRDIIHLHQGTISLKSEKGKGAICQIEVPVLALEDKSVVEVKNLINEEISKIYTDGVIEKAQSSPVKQQGIEHDKTILVIEDNVDMRNFLLETLAVHYNVIGAANGLKGMEFAVENVPDLIISDVLMPEKGGVETTIQLKNDLRTSHIPVVLLTARTADEQKLAGLTSLADAYMTKPFNMDVLLATIESMLANREMLKQKFTSDIAVTANKELSKLDKKFINDLSSIVEANLANEKLSVEDIANAMNFSRVQLYRKAKVLLDCSIAEYILNRRLQKAKFLLTNEKDFSIAEITFQTGFTSPNYFSTVFKSKYGVTPTEFKKKDV